MAAFNGCGVSPRWGVRIGAGVTGLFERTIIRRQAAVTGRYEHRDCGAVGVTSELEAAVKSRVWTGRSGGGVDGHVVDPRESCRNL